MIDFFEAKVLDLVEMEKEMVGFTFGLCMHLGKDLATFGKTKYRRKCASMAKEN